MTDDPPAVDPEAYVDAASALVGLEIDPAHRPGVVMNIQLVARMAALVMAHPLGHETEPAPVFTPLEVQP